MTTKPHPSHQDSLSELLRNRRSVRDFLPTPIPDALLDAVLADANQSPSWSNTQPYRIAIAFGPVRDILARELGQRFDHGMAAQRAGWLGKLKLALTSGALPDGDFKVNFEYPQARARSPFSCPTLDS